MKKTLTLITSVMLIQVCSAQVVHDSIMMNPGYADEVYYQFYQQARTHAPLHDWDIAFQTNLFTATVRVNDDNGITLYQSPTADSSNFYSFDTTGHSGWGVNYNSDSTWEVGAFNAKATGFPDFGWGVYDYMSTYNVYGNKVFLMEFSGSGSPTYKKIEIKEKTASGQYIFHFANLDNTGDHTVTLDENNYASKLFVYYSLQNNQVVDPQPSLSAWDIVFTRYLTYVQGVGEYLVTGVMTNDTESTARAAGVDVANVSYMNYLSDFSFNISEIGYDWKYFDLGTFTYHIVDSLIYFVKGKNDSTIYSLQFTGFNDTTGEVDFNTEFLAPMGIGFNSVGDVFTNAAIYPNPASDHWTLVYDGKNSGQQAVCSIFDLAGKQVYQSSFYAQQGLNTQSFALPGLPGGLYTVRLSSGNSFMTLKLVVSD